MGKGRDEITGRVRRGKTPGVVSGRVDLGGGCVE